MGLKIMGSKISPGAGAMPSPNAYYSPPSVEELENKLLWALGMTRQDLENNSAGITNVQRIGRDVVVTAYAGGKFSTHSDKIKGFPSAALVDKLRLLL
jgi:hypothetical protein